MRQRAAGRRVTGVRVRFGIRHAVDEESLAQAFGMMAEGTEVAGAAVELVTVPATIVCPDCGFSGGDHRPAGHLSALRQRQRRDQRRGRDDPGIDQVRGGAASGEGIAMCLGIPAQLVGGETGHPDLAVVDMAGVQRVINMALLEDPPGGLGAGALGFALSAMTPDEARDALAALGAENEAAEQEAERQAAGGTARAESRVRCLTPAGR